MYVFTPENDLLFAQNLAVTRPMHRYLTFSLYNVDLTFSYIFQMYKVKFTDISNHVLSTALSVLGSNPAFLYSRGLHKPIPTNKTNTNN